MFAGLMMGPESLRSHAYVEGRKVLGSSSYLACFVNIRLTVRVFTEVGEQENITTTG